MAGVVAPAEKKLAVSGERSPSRRTSLSLVPSPLASIPSRRGFNVKATTFGATNSAALLLVGEKRQRCIWLIQWWFRHWRTKGLVAPDGKRAEYGTLSFGLQTKPSPFLHCASITEPTKLLSFLTDRWRLPLPETLISVIGGAQNFDVSPSLLLAFTEGLADASSAARAWVITGGSNSGCMKVVGDSFAGAAGVVLIGVAPWGCVHHRDIMVGSRGGVVPYPSQPNANSADGAQLQKDHSHFLLIDNGKEGRVGWGGENRLRVELEAAICGGSSGSVSSVTIVMGGGPGTMDALVKTIGRPGMPAAIVLVVEAGGAAQAVEGYLRDGTVPSNGFASRLADFEASKPHRASLAMQSTRDLARHRCAHHPPWPRPALTVRAVAPSQSSDATTSAVAS